MAVSSNLARYSKIATDPLRNFRFIVDFKNSSGDTTSANAWGSTVRGGFSQVSGLGANVQGIQYREGGMNTTLHQVPGMVSFNAITLTRGVILGQSEALDWMKKMFEVSAGEGGTGDSNFRADLVIYVIDHPAVGTNNVAVGDLIQNKAYKMRFEVKNAWISSLSYSDLNATANDLMYETIQLVHEGISMKLAADGASNVVA